MVADGSRSDDVLARAPVVLARNVAFIGAAGSLLIVLVNVFGSSVPELSRTSVVVLSTSACVQLCFALLVGKFARFANGLLAVLLCFIMVATTVSFIATPFGSGAQTYIYFVLLVTVSGAAQLIFRWWVVTVVCVVVAWAVVTVVVGFNQLVPVVNVTPLILAVIVSGYLFHSNKVRVSTLVQRADSAVVSSHTDVLTGLSNRRGLLSSVEGVLVTDGGLEAAVSFIDVNGLKVINDSFGHDVGDRAIVSVADAIRNCFRVDDFSVRWGGDEFVVISFSSMASAEVLNVRLNEWLSVNTELPHPRVSVGQSRVVVSSVDELFDVVVSADKDMYSRRFNS